LFSGEIYRSLGYAFYFGEFFFDGMCAVYAAHAADVEGDFFALPTHIVASTHSEPL
jgi:hypothetical protein